MSYYNTEAWWDQWIPRNYRDILAKAVSPVTFNSKRELWSRLYWGILIEGGTQWVSIDRSTYKKVVLMVSAKALDINGGLDSRYWQWVAREDSRFGQAAEAKDVEWFEVWQRIDCTLLTPQTMYSVAFVLKIDRNKLTNCPSPFIFSLKVGNETPKELGIYLDNFSRPVPDREVAPFKYTDNGWMEFVVGEFNSMNATRIEVYMKNTDRNFRKKGIAIDGVTLTPRR